MIILNTMSRNIKIDIKKSPNYCSEILEAPPGFGPGVKELQSFALPLGYSAVDVFSLQSEEAHVPTFADTTKMYREKMERITRLELATSTLARWCSTN